MQNVQNWCKVKINIYICMVYVQDSDVKPNSFNTIDSKVMYHS